MLSITKTLCVLLALCVAFCGTSFLASSQTPQQSHRKDLRPVSIRGKQTFTSTCASCHGLDGRGGERAPNIADSAKAQRLSDAQIAHIIENGIPGTGMPAFHSLQNSDITAVVTYLRSLQGARMTVKLPGNPGHGEIIFFGKAGCASCHMVAGKGGFIASDLSAYARTHAEDKTRSLIAGLTPAGDHQARTVTAAIRSGEKYVGIIRNEDNFSLQLQTLDGAFHFVAKSDLESLEYSSQPLMPRDYGSTLSSSELNDVVSYLMSVANASAIPSEKPRKEFEEE
jgi:putative heme-binding domain-containing protein